MENDVLPEGFYEFMNEPGVNLEKVLRRGLCRRWRREKIRRNDHLFSQKIYRLIIVKGH